MHHEHDSHEEHTHTYAHTHSHEHDHGHDHEHPHDHSYTHSHDHGTEPHTHEHHPHSHDDHDHCHGQGHHHDHEHCSPEGCAGCSGCQHTPMEELVALMKYMANHNAAHAQELAALAKQLDDAGQHMAYEQVMQAVSDYEKGNMRLSAVLAALA